MNYIVWDKAKKEFLYNNVYSLNQDGKVCFMNVIHKNLQAFQDIGIEDINNNPIYADCSIVEFEYLGDKYKGYFRYNNNFARYDLVLLSQKDTCVIDDNFQNFKIIDTIQENKLGLIK